jgi:hypothetical protein
MDTVMRETLAMWDRKQLEQLGGIQADATCVDPHSIQLLEFEADIFRYRTTSFKYVGGKCIVSPPNGKFRNLLNKTSASVFKFCGKYFYTFPSSWCNMCYWIICHEISDGDILNLRGFAIETANPYAPIPPEPLGMPAARFAASFQPIRGETAATSDVCFCGRQLALNAVSPTNLTSAILYPLVFLTSPLKKRC